MNIRLYFTFTTIILVVFLLGNCTRDGKALGHKINEGHAIALRSCTTCHSMGISSETAIAPSMDEIKQEYIKATKGEVAFVSEMSSFLLKPSTDQSKMPHAVKKYNLMPNMGMAKDKYEAVAAFMYHSDLNDVVKMGKGATDTAPSSHLVSDEAYLDKGLNLALATKAILGKNLLTAIKEKGTDGAMEFCNVKALPLTDSMAIALDASIRRVSDKNRNPDNAANENELAYITDAHADIKATGIAKPKIQHIDGKVVGYYPIMTNDMCLQCHGKSRQEIRESTLSLLGELYPSDKAVDYTVNELRGIWVVEMRE